MHQRIRGCAIARCRCTLLVRAAASYGYTPRFSRWIRERHATYDAVIVQGIWQYNSFGVWRALRGTPTPYFVFPHGMLDPWFQADLSAETFEEIALLALG